MSNPLGRVRPLDDIITLAHQSGAPVLVDSIFATPYHARLAALRADLVAHSLTKFMAGHSDRFLGVMVGSQARLTER